MTFRKGDKVKFLNDVGGGTVIGFRDNKIVLVETEDGFDIPVLAIELVHDSEFMEEERPDSKGEEKGASKIQADHTDLGYKEFAGECILSIVPDNDKLLHVSDFSLFLINDSSYHFSYLISSNDGFFSELIQVGQLEPETKFEISKISQSDISKMKGLELHGFFYKPGSYKQQKPIVKKHDLSAFSFYKSDTFKENDYFHEKALVLKEEEINMKQAIEKLSKNEMVKVMSSKEEPKSHPKPKPENESGIEEVDLHIEQIVDNHQGMSNGEIVEIQLGRFETALETALRSKARKIVFIHGVGNGRLKHELRKKLDRKYTQLKYQDASFKEYGYGATMVYLK